MHTSSSDSRGILPNLERCDTGRSCCNAQPEFCRDGALETDTDHKIDGLGTRVPSRGTFEELWQAACYSRWQAASPLVACGLLGLWLWDYWNLPVA